MEGNQLGKATGEKMNDRGHWEASTKTPEASLPLTQAGITGNERTRWVKRVKYKNLGVLGRKSPACDLWELCTACHFSTQSHPHVFLISLGDREAPPLRHY